MIEQSKVREGERMIDQNKVREGESILQEYKNGKTALEKRVIANEQWYKMRHWEQIRRKDNGPQTASAWLFNSLANKHADAMDNYPQANLLPREERDKQDAEQLSKIVPVVMEQNGFEQTYNDEWWDKLKNGTGVFGVFWNAEKENGLGNIEIRDVDMLNIFWEPGISDIQNSRNVFTIALVDTDILQEIYPDLRFRGDGALNTAEYIHDSAIDTSKKSIVVDWYYKKRAGTKLVLHLIKFCEGNLLYASENEKGMENGIYDHGKYPFVFDVLFPEKDSPAGFGYVDIMKDAQISIDNMWISFEKNVKQQAEPRYFRKQGMGINDKQFADLSNSIVDYTGDPNEIIPIQVNPVSGIATNLYQLKIDELKETSANRDFSQGSTASGVTAASAIAALQEAGSKTSRDMIKASYRAYVEVVSLVVELIRQFYDLPREFRITGVGGDTFVSYDNSNIKPQPMEKVMGVEVGGRKPIFDIKITSQKSSPFSRIAQNELAKELYGAGLFNPELVDQALICLEMMDFEGKDAIVRKVAQNGAMMQQMAQMQAQIVQMAGIIDKLTGKDLTGAVTQGTVGAPMPNKVEGTGTNVNPLGDAQKTSKQNITDKARRTTQERTAVK